MSKVLEFKKPEKKEEWLHGTGYCLECKHEWKAAAPVGVNVFYCPSCGTEKGVWMGIVEPPSSRWECNCGNQLFFVTETGFDCARCGTEQKV